MEIISIAAADALDLAHEWQERGAHWHFHMLTPTCTFVPEGSHQHCIVLENAAVEGLKGVFSAERDMQLGEQLARIVHPRVFSAHDDLHSVVWLNRWLRRMEALNRERIPWHHHMLYPSCALNHSSRNWMLVFEDPHEKAPQTHSFRSQPEAHFNTIERLYWAQQAAIDASRVVV